MGKPGGIPADDPWFLFTNTSPQVTALLLLFLMGNWVYFSVLESSAWRATLGKKTLASGGRSRGEPAFVCAGFGPIFRARFFRP